VEQRTTRGPFTRGCRVEQPTRPTIEGDVVSAADAARLRGAAGGDRRDDCDAPARIDLRRGLGSSRNRLRPHQRKRRSLLRARDCAAERLSDGPVPAGVVRAETRRWHTAAPGPDRSEVARWKPNERWARILLVGHHRLSLAAGVGKRARLLPLQAVDRADQLVQRRRGRRNIHHSEHRRECSARDRPLQLLAVAALYRTQSWSSSMCHCGLNW